MGRMTPARQDDCEVLLLVGLGTRALGLAKDSSHLEEAHVPLTLAPVVLDAADQTWKEPAPQVGLLRRERVQDHHGVGAVGGAERERTRLEQPAPARDQLLAD